MDEAGTILPPLRATAFTHLAWAAGTCERVFPPPCGEGGIREAEPGGGRGRRARGSQQGACITRVSNGRCRVPAIRPPPRSAFGRVGPPRKGEGKSRGGSLMCESASPSGEGRTGYRAKRGLPSAFREARRNVADGGSRFAAYPTRGLHVPLLKGRSAGGAFRPLRPAACLSRTGARDGPSGVVRRSHGSLVFRRQGRCQGPAAAEGGGPSARP